MYRCAHTVPAPAFSERGSCNPDYASAMQLIGRRGAHARLLARDGVREVAAGPHDRGDPERETLTKAYLARIALTNAEGPRCRRCGL